MATARSIIRSALTSIQVYDPGEQILDADVATGFEALNNMVSKWSEEYLYLYTELAESLSWAMGATTGTIGLGGSPTFSAQRPTRIDPGPGRASVTASGTTYPVDVISAIEYEAIFNVAPGSGRPAKLYYDPQFPLGVINLLPAADQAYTLAFNSWVPFLSFADLSTVYVFSPGVENALKMNLPIALKRHFFDGPIDPETVMLASSAKDALMQTNMLSRAMLSATKA